MREMHTFIGKKPKKRFVPPHHLPSGAYEKDPNEVFGYYEAKKKEKKK